jgi:hypothetical protein
LRADDTSATGVDLPSWRADDGDDKTGVGYGWFRGLHGVPDRRVPDRGGGFLTLIIVGMVRSARDRRSRNERLADEHGDLAPGTFKLTPGFGGGDIDGGTGGL